MSQPEKQPEGGPDAGRRGGGRKREDLLGRPFPLGDWGEPATRLHELYLWAEDGALRTADWYLTARVRKRRAARLLRCGTALGVSGAALLPLLELTGVAGEVAGWGGVSLLAAAVCVGCDRWFGFSSGWMRDMATGQAVLRRLDTMRYDWAAESVREMLGPAEGTAGEAAERCLLVLRRFSEDVTELVRGETADWMIEFRGSGPALLTQAAGAPGARVEAGPPPRSGRSPLQSGVRPSMPRQRPPEGPR
ncbi:SLATT domain-containing protein [Streptomyces sp. ACA25]|uniref:SLATT domain-containing protein n=1 Tax=Streptomyces sp. ACA25 TaxID=3022596 RepID=UPI00230801F7|nr:SLATT domain-containing protein [Streptomyces sp. ACA25]MDB1086017.1 SLATT domain-containing protein [Streptomyces sp. ACA25]